MTATVLDFDSTELRGRSFQTKWLCPECRTAGTRRPNGSPATLSVVMDASDRMREVAAVCYTHRGKVARKYTTPKHGIR